MKSIWIMAGLACLSLPALAGQQYCGDQAVADSVGKCPDGSIPLYRTTTLKPEPRPEPSPAPSAPPPGTVSKGRGQSGSPIVAWACKGVRCQDMREYPSGLWSLQIDGGHFQDYVGFGTLRFILKSADGSILQETNTAPANTDGHVEKSVFVRSLKSGVYAFYYLPKNGDTILASGKFKVVNGGEARRESQPRSQFNVIDYNDPNRVNPYIVPDQVH